MGDMDIEAIAIEVSELQAERSVMVNRRRSILDRRLDYPISDLQTRLSAIEGRVLELEHAALEHNQLIEEGDHLRKSIAARLEISADLLKVERRIESLDRRLQIIVELAELAGVSLEGIDLGLEGGTA